MSDAEQFWAKVKRGTPDECWLWQGSTAGNHYGRFSYAGKSMNAHRVAYILTHGAVDASLDVCHTCDTPACVNPAHLWAGTTKQNTDDRIAKGRGLHVVTAEGRRHIQAACAAGNSPQAVADSYGISRTAVRNHLRTSPRFSAYTVVACLDDGQVYILVDALVVGSGRTYDEAMQAAFGSQAR